MNTTISFKKNPQLRAKLGAFAAWVFIIACALTVILIAIPSVKIIFLKANKHFLLKKTEIHSSLKIAPESQILNKLKLEGNIFAFDLYEIRQQLESMPSVQKATVERILPGTVKITLNEYLPVAVVSNGSTKKLINTKGRIFPIANYDIKMLPTINLSRRIALEDGKICEQKKLQSALYFIDYYKSARYKNNNQEYILSEYLGIESINLLSNDFMLVFIKKTKGLFARRNARIKLLYDKIHLSTDRAWVSIFRKSREGQLWQLCDATLQNTVIY